MMQYQFYVLNNQRPIFLDANIGGWVRGIEYGLHIKLVAFTWVVTEKIIIGSSNTPILTGSSQIDS